MGDGWTGVIFNLQNPLGDDQAQICHLFSNMCLFVPRTYHPPRRLLFTGQSPSPLRFVLPPSPFTIHSDCFWS